MTHPNPWTAEELSVITGKPSAEFTDVLAGIDQDDLYDTHRAALVAGVWNREDPINGVPATEVLGSLQVPDGGAIVTVGGTDGSVMILQPFDPNTPGMVPIPQQEAQAIADRMAEQIAADRARSATLELLPPGLVTAINPGQPGTPEVPTVDLEPLLSQLTTQAEQIAAQDELLNWLVGYITLGEAPE